MSVPCGMSPDREWLADVEMRTATQRYDGRHARKRVGTYDDLQIRVARLEAVAAEQAVLIQALIDRGKP